MQKTNNQYRQGDVLIMTAKMPAKLEPVQPDDRGYVLAEGEATGHAHTITSKGVRRAGRLDGDLYLDLGVATAVTHQEHDPIDLRPEVVRVRRQREYSPAAIRNVTD